MPQTKVTLNRYNTEPVRGSSVANFDNPKYQQKHTYECPI